MTTTESRLRDTLATLADPVEPEPAWQDRVAAAIRATGRSRPRRHRRRTNASVPASRGRARRLVPALVSIVVLLVVAGTVAVTQEIHRTADESPSTSTGTPEGPPPYIATIQGDYELTVRDATTGTVTATVPAPTSAKAWSNVEASADPSVFYAMAYELSETSGTAKVMRLVLDGAGRLVSSTQVFASAGEFDQFAVSPDGSRMVFSNFHGGLTVVDLGTGHTRTFSPKFAGFADTFLRWTGDGHQILYGLSTDGTMLPAGADDKTGIWALDPTHGGDDLAAASRWVAKYNDRTRANAVLVTVDAHGTRSYLVSSQGSSPRPSDYDVTRRIVEVDPATGRQLRVLTDVTHHNEPRSTAWNGHLTANHSGAFLLYNDSDGVIDIVNVATGHVTVISLNGKWAIDVAG